MSIPTLVRALRLPFTTVSALPFIFGSFLAVSNKDYGLNMTSFWLGLIAVITAHLGANLINDYADSKSGADWHDKNSYNFFGGSKLIQEGVLSEKFYLILAIIFSGISALAIFALAYLFQSALVVYLALLVLFLSWSYSMKPLQLSYHRLGEIAVFILFGPVPVMAGYYLQNEVFPDAISLITSLAFGLFTAAILYANEVPDYADDVLARKHNLANALPRERAYQGYYALSFLGLIAIIVAVYVGYLSVWTLLTLVSIALVIKAGTVLKNYSGDKMRLLESSKLAIIIHMLVSLILIVSTVI